MDLTRQSIGITFVFLLLWALLWWFRKKGITAPRLRLGLHEGVRELEVLQRIMLTPQHSLQMIRIRDRKIIVAVSPAGVHVLTDLEVTPK